jgi:hypothetical protein
MVRALEGSHIDDRGEYLVIRTPRNPDFWWGNFLLIGAPPQPGEAPVWLQTFATEFPQARHVALGVDVIEVSAVPEPLGHHQGTGRRRRLAPGRRPAGRDHQRRARIRADFP